MPPELNFCPWDQLCNCGLIAYPHILINGSTPGAVRFLRIHLCIARRRYCCAKDEARLEFDWGLILHEDD